ncbi:Hypothetical predicted protein, partial [Mytilus galloprovincialis]
VGLDLWKKKIETGKDFILKITCNDKKQVSTSGGYSINFQTSRNQTDGVIFHFNPRAPTSAVVLNTLHKTNGWGKEAKIMVANIQREYFEKPFKLRIHVLKDDTIHVYVNGNLLTEYLCTDHKITDTAYIVFSPFITIEKC